MPDTSKPDEQCTMHNEKIHLLELNMVEMKGDIKHIRDRIDNGLSSTISKVWDKLNTMEVARATILATVASNSKFIDKLKDAMIKISVGGVVGGVIVLVWKLIESYVINSPSV